MVLYVVLIFLWKFLGGFHCQKTPSNSKFSEMTRSSLCIAYGFINNTLTINFKTFWMEPTIKYMFILQCKSIHRCLHYTCAHKTAQKPNDTGQTLRIADNPVLLHSFLNLLLSVLLTHSRKLCSVPIPYMVDALHLKCSLSCCWRIMKSI